MMRAGADAASLLHVLRTARRLPLLVLVVLIIQVLAPALASGSARAAQLTSVICTSEGVRHVMVVETGVPAPEMPRHADCPSCGAHWQPTLPGTLGPLHLAEVVLDATLPPSAALPPDGTRLVAAHRTRAPPRTA
jgi:hypothetical protein